MVIKNLMAATQTKRGGKFFKTFFYPNAQSKHVCPLAYNVLQLALVADKWA
jgi:hypothetical protein